jgi:Transposase DDE domain group 1
MLEDSLLPFNFPAVERKKVTAAFDAGDGHYGRPEVIAWCEVNGVDYISGLAGNAVMDRLVEPLADHVRARRVQTQASVVRRYCETRYGARSWRCERDRSLPVSRQPHKDRISVTS